MQVNVTDKKTVYEYGLEELHRVSQDEAAHRKLGQDFREARGNEGARLHVTLQAINEADKRALSAISNLLAELQEKTAHLNHLIQSFEAQANRRFDGVENLANTRFTAVENLTNTRFDGLHTDLKQRAEALTVQINSFSNAEHEHFAAMKTQVGSFQQAIWNQNDTHFNAVSTQLRESTERLAFDTRKLRDEVVSLVDSRMNQADASFAAIRGDVEVVKYLVMDLIKDRIGRTDPKQKPF